LFRHSPLRLLQRLAEFRLPGNQLVEKEKNANGFEYPGIRRSRFSGSISLTRENEEI
jgi:hypothetical protein